MYYILSYIIFAIKAVFCVFSIPCLCAAFDVFYQHRNDDYEDNFLQFIKRVWFYLRGALSLMVGGILFYLVGLFFKK